jgi:hypothetical protein
MKANDLVGPYLQRQSGDPDAEGPDFIFRLQHTPLADFLALVGRLCEVAARLVKGDGPGLGAEEALLRPILEERERASGTFDPVQLVDFRCCCGA